MPTDPLVDEEFMLSALTNTKVGAPTVARMQTGAMLLLIDAYDRKTTRNEFAIIANTVMMFYASAAKLWLMGNIRERADEGSLDIEMMEGAVEGLIDVCGRGMGDCRELAELLAQCPLKADKIN